MPTDELTGKYDTEDSVALVLSGGGAKGAYQAGVWKALVETGVAERVRIISGTSVGAINAAAFAMIRDPGKIKAIWHDGVSSIVTPNFTTLSPINVLEALDKFADGKQFPLQGILDRDALRDILGEALKDAAPQRGHPFVYATSLECLGGYFKEFKQTSYRKKCFRLDDEQTLNERIDRIMASCAIPFCFSPVEINGNRYVDGGWTEMGGENIPLSPIFQKHKNVSTIVIVRCNSKSIEAEPLRIPRGTRAKIIEIRPRQPLPGIFNSDNLGGGLLMGALVPGSQLSLATKAIGGLFASNRAKIWGATLAFSPAFTDRFFEMGYEDGFERFQEYLAW